MSWFRKGDIQNYWRAKKITRRKDAANGSVVQKLVQQLNQVRKPQRRPCLQPAAIVRRSTDHDELLHSGTQPTQTHHSHRCLKLPRHRLDTLHNRGLTCTAYRNRPRRFRRRRPHMCMCIRIRACSAHALRKRGWKHCYCTRCDRRKCHQRQRHRHRHRHRHPSCCVREGVQLLAACTLQQSHKLIQIDANISLEDHLAAVLKRFGGRY